MTDIAIRVENLSKLYHLGALHQRPDTLRDALTGFLPRISRTLAPARSAGVRRNQTENSLNSPNSRQASQENSPNSPNSRQASQENSPNSPNSRQVSQENSLNSPNSRQASQENSPNSPNSRQASDDLWALRDVSFEVKRGEVVGIIGRNGAGKSTLLKILSRITEPTSGRAEIHGRVGSLLEVGTGFHPELTGRENIYLNGAILGMHRHEIQRRFDEIVAFAEIERFLDTPVKRYSSGMYVRLAFAVAAHLEPEILLVDEVLAVGDAQFQKKCLGKMGDVAKEGRTILFVSHNMGAIRNLCQRSVLLSNGFQIMSADTEEVIREYLGTRMSRSGSWVRTNPIVDSTGVYIERIFITDDKGTITDTIDCRQPFTLNMVLDARGNNASLVHIHVRFTNEEGIAVFTTANTDSPTSGQMNAPGRYHFKVNLPGEFLRPGSYSLIIASMLPKTRLYDIVEDEIRFSVEDIGSHATILRDARLGVVTPVLNWENASNDESV